MRRHEQWAARLFRYCYRQAISLQTAEHAAEQTAAASASDNDDAQLAAYVQGFRDGYQRAQRGGADG